MSNIFTDSNVSTIANGVAAYSNMNNKGAANKSAKMSNNMDLGYEMFCYQCEQTANGKGCTKEGVCGKTAEVRLRGYQ